jgi:hypothetical protein
MSNPHTNLLNKIFSDLSFTDSEKEKFNSLFGASSPAPELKLQGLEAILSLCLFYSKKNVVLDTEDASEIFAHELLSKFKKKFGEKWEETISLSISQIKKLNTTPWA